MMQSIFLNSSWTGMVKKTWDPPDAPKIRPIENYLGILKMKVYEGNWSAKTRDHSI